MKKLKILFYTLLLVLSSSLSFSQGWLWGKGGFGPLKSNDYASPVATDKNGNAFITGQYFGTIVFGTDTLTDLTDDAYLTKYNSSGMVMWAKQIIDTNGTSLGYSDATDKTGNVYIAGSYEGNAKADTFSLTSNNSNNLYAFLIKYNTNGKVLWAKQNTTPLNSSSVFTIAYSVATDKMGNVFITGTFYDTVSFGSFSLMATNYAGSTFLVKYDSSGNVLWAKQSENTVDSLYYYGAVANSATADKDGNAYITGYFYDTVSFGGNKLYNTNIGSSSSFLVKYSPAGNVIWAKQSTLGSFSSICYSNAVITDRGGYPYITGYFQDIVKFGNQTIYSPSAYSAFITKYDTNGNAIWAHQSSPGWIGTGLASDGINYIYMSGINYYNTNPDTLKFHNYALATNPWAYEASYVMKFDTMGYPICGSILNGLGYYGLNGVASDSTGTYVYTASTFLDTVNCGPDTLINSGAINTFVGRWLNCNSTDAVPKITAQNGSITVYPNPSSGMFTFQAKSDELGAKSIVEVYNMIGQQVYTNTIVHSSAFIVDLTNQPNGIYLYRVVSDNGSLLGNGKLIIQK